MGAQAKSSRSKRSRTRTIARRPAWTAPRPPRREQYRRRRPPPRRRLAEWLIPIAALLEFVAWGMAMNFDSLGIDVDSPSFWLPLGPAGGAVVSAVIAVQAAIQAKAGFGLVLVTLAMMIATILGGLSLWFVLEFARNFSF